MLKGVKIANSLKCANWVDNLWLKTFKQKLPLVVMLALALTSFIYGWYFDMSKPVAGRGWSDQTSYLIATNRLSSLELPKADELHFAVGYPLLGVVGKIFYGNDPFVVVSLILFVGSITLSFKAAKTLFGTPWALLFSLLLLSWDFVGRSFNFATELFIVPWNNQMLFFLMSFYFWLFTTKAREKPSWRLMLTVGFLSGFVFLSREEAILFIIPAVTLFVFLTKAGLKKLVVSFLIIGLLFLPQILVKLNAYGSVTKSGRSDSYSDVRSHYLRQDLLLRNIKEVVVNSDYASGSGADRSALLQAAPWLWLSPIGLIIILSLKKYPQGLRAYILISLILILFYLSGANMSAEKLRFNCLRYIAPGMIALNLGTLVFAKELFDNVKNMKASKRAK